MKYLKPIAAFALAILMQSCISMEPDDSPRSSRNYRPVIMKRDVFEKSIRLQSPQPVSQSGKIYIKDNLLFVNDVKQGFHVYDYTNPSTPKPVAYIEIPGATDLAVRNNIIYINQATDLVTLAYANNAITLIKRNPKVFPQKQSPDDSYANPKANEIIINWIPK